MPKTERAKVKPMLYRADEVAKALGVSRSTAYILIKDGTLPSVRIGKSVRVHVDEVQRWVDGLRQNGHNGEGE